MVDKSYFKSLPAGQRLFGPPHKDRPFVLLKLATSLDGRIATASGASKWITNELSRSFAHRIRAEADAILVGSNTARTDDPELTCRLPGLEHLCPVRVVLDRKGSLPSDLKIFKADQTVPTWVCTNVAKLPYPHSKLIQLAQTEQDGIDLTEGLERLKNEGIDTLMVEGGARLAQSLLTIKGVDRLVWFHAPKVLGGDALPAIGALNLDKVEDGPQLNVYKSLEFGDDRVGIYDLT